MQARTDGGIGGTDVRSPLGAARRDVVALGIAGAAILLFIGTGTVVLPQVMRAWFGGDAMPDPLLANALMLNIALMIFGWRRYIELAQEMRERTHAEDRARQLADTDPLTGLLNRRSLHDAIMQVADAARMGGDRVAVLMFDLDKFKQVNDRAGHEGGDAVLAAAARRLSELLPPGGVCARLGGDEFACALPVAPTDPSAADPSAADPSAADPNAADQVAERMLAALRRPIAQACGTCEITVSCGIAVDDPAVGAFDPPTMLRRADLAMYRAKQRGGDRVCRHDDALDQEVRLREALGSGLRTGIPAGEVVPYYQPQVDIGTEALVGFEMLARWHSPGLGLVMPELFVPVAEQEGLIGAMFEALVARAFEDAKAWHPSLKLSVNVSPIQLRDPWFAQKLLKRLALAGFPPARLDIEITETALHDDIAAVRATIISLRNQGVTISLDDFGTGYSSLAQLRTLPFDRLKIDRSFVSDLADDGASARIIEAIMGLGEGLQLPITAEGIEDERMLGALRRFGPMTGQGYMYGKAADSAATAERLAVAGLLAEADGAGIRPASPPGAAGDPQLADRSGPPGIAAAAG